MPDILASSIEFGGYISIVKLIIFLGLFFPLLPLLGWIYNDAVALEERSQLWTGIILGAAAAAIAIWIVVPFFIAGMLFYIIAVGASALAYIKGRNALVIESEKVLTAEHIKGLFFGGEGKKLKEGKKFVFVMPTKTRCLYPNQRQRIFTDTKQPTSFSVTQYGEELRTFCFCPVRRDTMSFTTSTASQQNNLSFQKSRWNTLSNF